MASPTRLQRNLVILIAGLVVVQIVLVGGLGWMPSFKAGYFNETADARYDDIDRKRKRLKELETSLAPAPVLEWSDYNPDNVAPNQSPDVSFNRNPEKNIGADSSLASDGKKDERLAVRLAPKEADVVSPRDRNETGDLASPMIIAPVYFEQLPDLSSLSSEQRKKQFVAIVLPLALRANQELTERRQSVQNIIANGDMQILRNWAELYGIKSSSDDFAALGKRLLKHINTVPVSIVLGQAAIESGWGTSRFALQGNALFGQWAWSQNSGIKPTDASDDRAVVRSFSNLFDSVRAYMHNLNTHFSYEDFREVRENSTATPEDLIATLINYSQERDVYLEKLKTIISVNDFKLYDQAILSGN